MTSVVSPSSRKTRQLNITSNEDKNSYK